MSVETVHAAEIGAYPQSFFMVDTKTDDHVIRQAVGVGGVIDKGLIGTGPAVIID